MVKRFRSRLLLHGESVVGTCKCEVCKAAIDIARFGWWVVESNRTYSLKHIQCP